MDHKSVFGGLLGALITLIFSLGSLLVLNDFSAGSLAVTSPMPLGLVIMLMAPVAGGFSAGLIGHDNPHQAGLITGIGASLVILITWSVISGISWAAILGGLVISFVWIFLSRIGAGFTSSR